MKNRAKTLHLLALAAAVLATAAQVTATEPSGQPVERETRRFEFRDVSLEAGVTFQKVLGSKELTNIVEDTGSGCAFFDYDGDGLPDLYFVNACYLPGLSDARRKSDPSQARAMGQLYRNLGDGRFEDVTERAGLAITFYGMACAVGDYDNDGYPDLYITCYGPNHLFRNRGDGTFVEATEKAGVSLAVRAKELKVNFSVAASFLDYDRDGNLDLFVGNYLVYDPSYHLFYPADAYPGPMAYAAQPDTLFRNNGNGTFTDVSIPSGVAKVPPGRSMGLSIGDVDGDGYPDVYVANDKTASHLYVNQRDGTFQERSRALRCAGGLGGEGVSAMAVEFADLDSRGCFDLYVTAGGYGAIYRNDLSTAGRFRDMTAMSGTAAASGQYIGWGGGVRDLDNDGIEDLVRFNGDFNHLQPQEDLLFAGLGGFRFEDVSSTAGPYFQVKLQSRGAAFADYDLDGLVDFAVVTLNAKSCLVKNASGGTGNWLRLELVGRYPRDPIGVRVRVTCGDRKFLTMVRGSGGYLSQSERPIHLGLGLSTRVDRLEVLWDHSPPQVFTNVPVNRALRIVEPLPTSP